MHWGTFLVSNHLIQVQSMLAGIVRMNEPNYIHMVKKEMVLGGKLWELGLLFSQPPDLIVYSNPTLKKILALNTNPTCYF